MPTEHAISTEKLEALRTNIERVFIGHRKAVDQLLCCLIARGHVLIEDVPGVGKTVLAMALARSVDCRFSRIQLTPDLLPSDVLGVTVFDRNSGEFDFKRGPIFSNILLADEINRTTPRTQSALLESMNEGTVSIDGKVIELEQPFMVIATQNPYEFEGTYPLPENQLDRFLMRIRLGYPNADDEARIIEVRPGDVPIHELAPVMHANDVLTLRRSVDGVRLDRSLVDYIVAIAQATREHEEVHLGLSTRGSMALAQSARASAILDARDYCIPEDITDNFLPVAGHRVLSRAFMTGGDARIGEQILSDILETVPTPD